MLSPASCGVIALKLVCKLKELMMNKVVSIKIKGSKYKLKSHSYRAMFLFEDITGKQVTEIATIKDQVLFLWCILKSSNKDFEFTFEEFVDIIEEEESILEEFAKLNEGSKKK